MEIIEKLKVLAKYLALSPDQIEDIIAVDEENSIFEYEKDDYKVLTDDEVNIKIDDIVKSQVDETLDALNKLTQKELSDALEASGLEYYYNLKFAVNENAILDDIEDSYAQFLGSGTVEIFEDLYIFEL